MMSLGRSLRGITVGLVILTITNCLAQRAAGQRNDPALHSDPLNFDPRVREAYQRFYNLDYDTSLGMFESVL